MEVGCVVASILGSTTQVKAKTGSCCFPPAEFPVSACVCVHLCVCRTDCIMLFTSSGVSVGVFLVNAG